MGLKPTKTGGCLLVPCKIASKKSFTQISLEGTQGEILFKIC